MILHFTVEIEGDEKSVPYLKSLLAGHIVGHKPVKVIYHDWLTDRDDKWAEAMERTAFEKGEIEL